MSPNGALIRASDRSCFEPFLDNGHLSLNRLLQTRKFALGINRNRNYGAGISPLLTRHTGQPYLIKKAGQGATPALLSDLSAQRGVDLALAHPLKAAYWIKTSRSPIPLHFLPIVEAPDNEQYQIACSRTPQGQQAITAINGLLADPEFRQDYLRAYANWQEQLAGQLPGAPLQASDPGLMR